MLKYILSVLLILTPFAVVQGQCGSGSCTIPSAPSAPYSAPYAAPSAPAQQEEMEPIIPADLRVKIEQATVQVIAIASQEVSRTEYVKGSGTIIRLGDRLAVITAGHVVADSKPHYLQTSDGITARYEIRYFDRVTDFAILEPSEKQEILYERGVEIFSGYPDSNGFFILSGYDSTTRVRLWRGRLLGRLLTTGTREYHWIQLNRPSREGDSGGGIFSSDGRLFGIIWGTDGSRTVATIIDPVTLYLNKNYQTCLFWRFRKPRPPETPPVIPGPIPDPGPIPGPGQVVPGPGQVVPGPGSTPPAGPPLTPVPTPSPSKPSIWTEVLNGLIIGLIGYCAFMLVFLGIETFNILRKV